MDWGYETLHLRSSDDAYHYCQGYYDQDYTQGYLSTLTEVQFMGNSDHWFFMSQLETFQVTFL